MNLSFVYVHTDIKLIFLMLFSSSKLNDKNPTVSSYIWRLWRNYAQILEKFTIFSDNLKCSKPSGELTDLIKIQENQQKNLNFSITDSSDIQAIFIMAKLLFRTPNKRMVDINNNIMTNKTFAWQNRPLSDHSDSLLNSFWIIQFTCIPK